MLRHVDALRRTQGALVIVHRVIVIGDREVIPAGMIWVDRHRAVGERGSPLEVASVDEQRAHERHGIGVSRIERQDPIDGVREPLPIVLEEVTEGQRLPRVLTVRIELECPRHGLSGAHERLGPDVEIEAVLVQIQVRQGRPERRERRLPLDGALEEVTQETVLVGRMLPMVRPGPAASTPGNRAPRAGGR